MILKLYKLIYLMDNIKLIGGTSNPELSKYVSYMECLSHIETSKKDGDKETIVKSVCNTKYKVVRVPKENPKKDDSIESISKLSN